MHRLYSLLRSLCSITTAALIMLPINSFADVACGFDVLDLKIGQPQSVAKELMLAQGFRELPVGRSGGMRFTTREVWPPADVTLNRQEQRLIAKLQDPRQRLALKKRAESDSTLKATLDKLASIPSQKRSDVIDVRIGLTRASANGLQRITRINADYQFPSDPNGKDVIYSPSHKNVNQARWVKYCSGVDLSELRDRRFMETVGNQVRVCQNNPSASGHPIKIGLYPIPKARKYNCSYSYIAGPKSSSEYIK